MSTDNTEVKTFTRKDGSVAKIPRKKKAPKAEKPAETQPDTKAEKPEASNVGAGTVALIIGAATVIGMVGAHFVRRHTRRT